MPCRGMPRPRQGKSFRRRAIVKVRTVAKTSESIEIRGARTHNLRAVDLDLPRGTIVVFTGVSGSGKSSLAIDTIFAEGQRRYLECVAPYARAAIDQLPRPELDSIHGLPPTLSVAQVPRGAARNPRATVATLTEIHDHLRLLYARCGSVFCPQCGAALAPRARADIVSDIAALPEGERIWILAPLVRGQTGQHRDAFLLIRREGFLRARLDGTITLVDSPPDIDANKPHDLEMVVDRQVVRPDMGERLAASIETATKHGGGTVIVSRDIDGEWEDRCYSTRPICLRCQFHYRDLEPRTFNFNSPYGACPACHGLGYLSPDDPEPAEATPKRSKRDADDEEPEEPPERQPCPDCGGARLAPAGRSVRVGGLSLPDATALSIGEAREWLEKARFADDRKALAEPILRELAARLIFLERVGVGYIELDRPVDSLSGGEAQRIRLASCVGAGLNGACYVLDEPTVGLHARDVGRLLDVIDELRDQDNTVVLVEHDAQAMRRADRLVELGPGAGAKGGQIVQQGTWEAFLAGPGLTADYLSGRRRISDLAESTDRPGSSNAAIRLSGARHHNLKRVSVEIPLGRLVCVTGVSGSGKSSLITETLVPAARYALGAIKAQMAGPHERLEGIEQLTRLVEVVQRPIGRSPRSTPATFAGLLDPIRQVFARTREAKARGFTAARFSPNQRGGQCAECKGLGAKRVRIEFIPEEYVPCPVCGGRRFNRATLSVRFKDKSIADVLALTVEEALAFLSHHPAAAPVLKMLSEVGLGYLRLDQWATTLSGGEAQRLKLATELARLETGPTLFVLDEPTTGLHFHDVARLLGLLRRLIGQGHSVIVIEHHLDLIAASDWVIDLGPEGGAAGGEVVAVGAPADIAARSAGATGRALADHFGKRVTKPS